MTTSTRTRTRTRTRTSGAATASGAAAARSGAPIAPTPLDLPRQRRTPSVAIIDIDNIAIGSDGRIDRAGALAALAEVYRSTVSAEVNLALVSGSVAAALGQRLWFGFPGWTIRVADSGRDAADHELLAFAHAVVDTRGSCTVLVASGDGIFADLAQSQGVAMLQVVLPAGHGGVSRRLRGYLRPSTRAAHDLAA